jgi:hypothetical protein
MRRIAHRPRFTVAGLLALALASPSHAWGDGNAGDGAPATAKRTVFTSEAYRFTIAAMPAPWRALDERSARELVPDAIAGVTDGGGRYAVVIAEAAPEGELEELARFLVDSMGLEGFELIAFEPTTFRDLPAYRAEVGGRVNDLDVRYESVIFLREGYLFQALGFGLGSGVRPGTFAPFFDAITLLEGEITGAAAMREVPDTAGVGWRVAGGKFESAVYRLAVAPPEGWRVAVGAELRQMNGDAEIGLVHVNPEAYVTVIAERAAGVDRAAFATMLLETGDGLRRRAQAFDASVAGRPVTLHRFTLESPPIEMWRGVFFEGDTCYQVVAWYMGGLREKALEALPAAFASIRVMSEAEADALAAALEAGRDPQNRVGSDFALRRGVYRDFARGFAWRKPEGFWRVLAGDEARAENPDALLVLEAPALGVFGTLVGEPVFAVNGPEYHEACRALMAPDPEALPAPREVTVGGRPALVSVFDGAPGEAAIRYQLATIVEDDVALQMVFWGLTGNMESSAAQLDRALEGFVFPPHLSAVEANADTYTDVRLGYALDLPDGRWRRRDMTPEAMLPVSSFTHWTAGDDNIVVVAMCALKEGQDARWFQSFTRDLVRERLGTAISGAPARSTARLGGAPAERLTWKDKTGSLDLFVCVSDLTAYAVVVASGGKAPLAAETVASGFKLLE